MADNYFEARLGATKVTTLDLGGVGDFDRVYKTSKGGWYIVECKGGSSPLKGRRGANGTYPQQGTEEYIRSIVANLQVKLSPPPLDLVQLIDALDAGKVTSYVLRQDFDLAGNLKPTQLATKVIPKR